MGPPCLGLQETLTVVVHCQLASGPGNHPGHNLLIYLMSLRLDGGLRATGVTQAHPAFSMPMLLGRSDQCDVHQAKVHGHGKQCFPSRKTRKWREKHAIFLKTHTPLVRKGEEKRNHLLVEHLVSHSDTKVWYHSLQSSAGPPLLRCLCGSSQVIFQDWVLTLFLGTADHPGKMGLLQGHLANPDGTETCSDAAWPCQDQLLLRLWCRQKPSLVLFWYGASDGVASHHQMYQRQNRSNTSKALERPKGGFFWLHAGSKAGL